MQRRLARLLALLAVPVLAGATPGSLDPAALEALVNRAGELDTDALVVLHDGKPVLEKWFDGEPRKIQSMSITKSIAALAVGRLLTTGKLESLDVPVHTWYPEWRQGRKRSITVRHLLTQTSGLQGDAMTASEINDSPDFIQLALCAELTDDPGARFFYNNKATNLVAGLVQRVSGMPLDQYLKKEIFAPLGISDVAWLRDPAGNPQGMSGLLIRPADLARVGQLMLDGGRWGKQQLLRADWVTEATTPTPKNNSYGQMWWVINDVAVTIDDPLLATWRKGGADEKFVRAIEPLKGRVLRDDLFDVVGAALKDAGGLKAWDANTWQRGLPDGQLVERKVVGFRGDGWQGQHLVVLKEQRIVVVRMREPSQGNTVEENKRFGFQEITKMSRSVVRPR